MEKKAFFRLTLAAFVAGAGFLGFIQSAPAAEAQFIWSTTSAQINQSTQALAEGRNSHAIRFAKETLRSKTHAANHLIARHNLCLAYLAEGKGGEAKPYCDLALATEARYRIVDQNGRWVVSSAESGNESQTQTVGAAVRANVARAQGSALAENR